MLTEIRIAFRSLLKSKGFALTAVLTLGLGVALCAASYLVLNAYLFRTLPYPAAERLYSVSYATPGENPPPKLESLDWRSLDDVIEHPIAWDLDAFYLVGEPRSESTRGAWVTEGFVAGLGIQPAIGRGFDREAFAPGGSNVALISDRLWRTRYGGDPGIVGQRFNAYVSDRPAEAETFTIIGVLPANFWHVNVYTDVLVPLRAATYPYMVRLREGVQPSVAGDRITSLVASGTTVPSASWRVTLESTHGVYVQRLLPILRAMSAAAALVLLVALANVAGLLLVRSTRRQKEMAVRRALGAGRAAIARLLLVEALLLSLGATIVGLVASAFLMAWLAPIVQRELGRVAPGGLSAFAVDWSSVAMAAVVGLGIAAVCTIAPLMATWRGALLASLQGGGRGTTEGKASQRVRSLLIAVEIAVSLALVAGSTLMLRSVINLVRVDFGIDASNVTSFPMTLRQRSYPEPLDRLALYERTLERLAAIPGVTSVSVTNWWPLQQPQPRTIVSDRDGARSETRAGLMAASPEYFSALGVNLAAGRLFSTSDRIGSEPVAIVSRTLAERIASRGSPLGAQVEVVEVGRDGQLTTTTAKIVGVVDDVKQSPDDRDQADIYVPLFQSPGRFSFFYVKTAGDSLAWVMAMRAALREIDPEISVDAPTALQSSIALQSARPKFLAWLLGGFSTVATILALVGVYGVIAYAVRQREREIAVRLAVGAEPRRITRLFLTEGSRVMLAGLALGLLAALGAGRALESQLFGVGAVDPITLTITALGFALAGYLAIWWPARRAAATDPAAMLKEEN
jgi:predicted permease